MKYLDQRLSDEMQDPVTGIPVVLQSQIMNVRGFRDGAGQNRRIRFI
jgi:hypothetical protein